MTDGDLPPELGDAVREFVDGVAAAIQPMAAIAPFYASHAIQKSMRSSEDYYTYAIMCRATSVAVGLAFMRVLVPSGDSFSLGRLTEILEKNLAKDDPRLTSVRQASKRKSVQASIHSVKRWRDTRIAHRVLLKIRAEQTDDRKAVWSDFVILADFAAKIVDALVNAFPGLRVRNFTEQREEWNDAAVNFWQRVSGYPPCDPEITPLTEVIAQAPFDR